MIDKEQIGIMIRNVEGYFSDLETIHIESKKELEEPEKKHAVSMIVFSIMNRVIDISNEILAGSKNPLPASYRDSFEILRNAKIISPGTSKKMIWLMRYRNIIAHQYYVLGAEEIYTLKKKVYEVEEFLKEIKKHLK